MHRPPAPILDKSWLFVVLPSEPQNQNRYVRCPATGHLYCTSTGSLYMTPITPLSANNSSLLQGRDSCLLPSIPTPCATKTFSVNSKSTDQQDNGSSTTLSIESNMSHKVKDVDQPIQDNSTPITRSNIAPDVKNVDEPVQSNSASSISKTASKVNLEGRPIQCNIPSIISHVQSNKNPNVKTVEQPMQGISALMTPKPHKKKASKSKTKTNTQATSPTQRENNSANLQSNSDPTTSTKMQKFCRKAKKKSVHKKKSASSKKKKSTVPPQPKPTTSIIKKSLRFRNRARPVQPSIWSIVRPFNRRRRPHHYKKKSLVSIQGKNCIMASSVHEIIYSRFAENTNKQMPVSQIKAMLSSGDRKLRTRSEWIKRMEEEAIHKYKEMNLDKHNRRLQIRDYEVLHHKEKFWLACSNISVINRTAGESWPLLVKCLDKYPDSTLRQASKHRSFCLSWNGIYYTLRMDHAYYTQIQCLMAITNTSYAELVVHTHKETTFLPVHFNIDFWKQAEETLETFFTNNILPYLEKNKLLPNPVSSPLVSENGNDLTEE